MHQQLAKLEGLVVNLFDLHVSLREDHKALCDCLCSADLLRMDDLREAGRARRMSARVRNVLETPRLAHALGLAAGIAATDRLGAAAHVGSNVRAALSEREREALLQARIVTPRKGGLQEILRTPKVALELGCAVGVGMTRRLARTSRAYGEGMRTALPRVAARLPPGIYAVGGFDSAKAAVNTAECFDVTTGTWETLPSMPSLRSGCAAARVEGCLYFVGGHRGVVGEQCLPTCERFDPMRDVWEVLPSMNAPRRSCSAAGHRGMLYVVGAEGEDAVPVSAERFSPTLHRWERLPSWTFGGCRHCQIVSAGQLYHVAAQATGSAVMYLSDTSAKWETLPPRPVGPGDFQFSVAAASGDTLYILGRSADSPVCEKLYLATHQWERLHLKGWSATGVPRSMCAVSGRLYILSGSWCRDTDTLQAEGVCVNLSSCRCQAWLPPLPTARIECGLVTAWR